MNLNEKLLYCRKKAGLSQEALAEQIGVSRQAVSKWETGEAMPELTKLKSLADAFDVSADWLLSDEPVEPSDPDPVQIPTLTASQPQWVDALPGMIKRMIRSYGWLAGVHLAVSGASITGLSALALYITGKMLSNPFGSFDDNFPGVSLEPAGGMFSDFASNNPVTIMSKVLLGFGIILMIGGVLLAFFLKKWGEKQEADSGAVN